MAVSAYPLGNKLHAIVPGVSGIVTYHACHVGGYRVPDALSRVYLLVEKSTDATSGCVTVSVELVSVLVDWLRRW